MGEALSVYRPPIGGYPIGAVADHPMIEVKDQIANGPYKEVTSSQGFTVSLHLLKAGHSESFAGASQKSRRSLP